MKKIFMGMIATALLASCNPTEDSFDMNAKTYTDEDLSSIVTFVQMDKDGNVTPDGNYFTYTTSPATIVSIIALRADGSENILATGASGSFVYAPSRGSDPQQTLYVRAMNGDGTSAMGETSVTVFVPGELEPVVKILASNDYGSKTWKWDPSISPTGAVWGNMGYCGGAGSAVGTSGEGQWWGINEDTDPFNDQLQHTEDGINHGDGDLNAYMVFSEDGLLKSYDAAGNVIREGTFEVSNYDPSNPTAWKVGDLVTNAILWPYEINSGGNIPGIYEICYLTADKMTLVYPDGGDFGGLGSWGEATFWHFCSDTDFNGMTAGYENGKSWTWDNSVSPTGAVWGNMGYCGGAGSAVGTSGEGQWWGINEDTDPFNDQLQHTEDETNHGDGDLDAFMVLGTDGTIKRCAADGTVINSGTYEFVPVTGNDWKVAELNTTAGTILWPYEINSGGNMPTTFEVVYLTSSKMTLVYPDGGDFGGLGSWGEATFWHFKAKE